MNRTSALGNNIGNHFYWPNNNNTKPLLTLYTRNTLWNKRTIPLNMHNIYNHMRKSFMTKRLSTITISCKWNSWTASCNRRDNNTNTSSPPGNTSYSLLNNRLYNTSNQSLSLNNNQYNPNNHYNHGNNNHYNGNNYKSNTKKTRKEEKKKKSKENKNIK